jgi:hypothetical protein
MIKNHSDDADVEAAAASALEIIKTVLAGLAVAEEFDYGGHELHIGEYGVCSRCTSPIAEAQQARDALLERAKSVDDDTIREHIELAAQLFDLEAQTATVRAKFHNGHGTEQILNELLAFQYNRAIHDEFDHSHHKGQ